MSRISSVVTDTLVVVALVTLVIVVIDLTWRVLVISISDCTITVSSITLVSSLTRRRGREWSGGATVRTITVVSNGSGCGC